MADWAFRAPRAADIATVAKDLRAADAEECRAQGLTPRAALREGLATSTLCWAFTVDGEAAGLLGVAPMRGAPGVGVPWFLGTDRVPRVALMRLAPAYIDKMLGAYPHLLNFVHANNARAIRWLKRMGFVLADAKPFGPKNALFRQFEMHADGPSRPV